MRPGPAETRAGDNHRNKACDAGRYRILSVTRDLLLAAICDRRGIAAGVKLPAAGVHLVQRWRGEPAAGFGWLPGDQRGVAAAGAADVDDGPVRLACRAVPGLGDAVTVEVQPDDGEVFALLQCLVPGGGFAPAGRAGQGGPRGSGAGRCSGRLTDAWHGSGCGGVADGPAGAAGRALLPANQQSMSSQAIWAVSMRHMLPGPAWFGVLLRLITLLK
jgi:hypothetical protein